MATEYKMNYTGSEVNAKLGLMPSLGITGAEVGQTVKITAVDDNGRPTAWEPVTLGDKWELLGTLDFSESSNGDDMVLTWDDPVRKIYINGRLVDTAGETYSVSSTTNYRTLYFHSAADSSTTYKSVANFGMCSHGWGAKWYVACEYNGIFAHGYYYTNLIGYNATVNHFPFTASSP